MPAPQPSNQPESASLGLPSSLPAQVAARLRSRLQQSSTSPLKKVTPTADSASVMQRLSSEVRGLETAGRQATNKQTISCGCEALDRCLPDGGYVPGSVIEYLRAMPGCGASTLAFTAAAMAMKSTNGFLVVIDTQHNIYPPALASWGIDLDKVVLVRPQSDVDALWAVDQSLRTPAVAAVVADVERIDDRAARRMQLAAEQGGGIALLLRPASARRGPSWADIQWMVRALVVDATSVRTAPSSLSAPAPTSLTQDRRLQVQLVRVRGGKAGATVRLQVSARDGTLQEVERHEPTGALHLASQLASAASPSRRAAAS
jgi:protein ImuA